MFDPTQAAYSYGEKTALRSFGVIKDAGWAGSLARGAGKVLNVGGKLVGATGVGAPVGAVLGGLGSGISSAASGENAKQIAARTLGGAVAGAMPAGSGFIAGAAMDAGMDKAFAPKPQANMGMTNYNKGPATGPMPGMAGQGHLPGMVSY